MSRDFLPVDAEVVTGETDLFKVRQNSVITEEEYKESKKYLDAVKKQASLQVEGKKLGMINLIVDNMTKNIELMNSANIEVKSAMDLKFLAEANEKNYKMLENLLRIDSADSGGTAMQTQIMIKTVDRNGNGTNAFIGIKNG